MSEVPLYGFSLLGEVESGDAFNSNECGQLLFVDRSWPKVTGVPRSLKSASPQDPTVGLGLSLGPYARPDSGLASSHCPEKTLQLFSSCRFRDGRDRAQVPVGHRDMPAHLILHQGIVRIS